MMPSCANFLTKTLAPVSTGVSLHVLAHNLERVSMSVLGIAETMKAMRLAGV